ncbi:MAG: hypothetical protein ABS76_36205 [Pelagibacterium sp. SCN 64-44]|nr:MAG: hypothetical protein ABS76_36205 [Pelagibacterium sp. SCN 64-44]
MKVVFAGPSLFGVEHAQAGLEFRPPVRQGDILVAIEDGATHIGIIDGVFGFAPSIWHKEILYALSKGVVVMGSSSMGALRAAECQQFGMIPIGRIANAYVSGELDDDAAVALTMAPREFGYMPFVEPLVDVWPSIEAVVAAGGVTAEEGEAIRLSAEHMYFEERTVEAMIATALPPNRFSDALKAYMQFRVSQKSLDALELLAALRAAGGEPARSSGWNFHASPFWRRASELRLTVHSRDSC